jgi:hypothetical protein
MATAKKVNAPSTKPIASDKKEIAALQALREEANATEINSLEDAQKATDRISDVKARANNLVARRKQITKPLDDAKSSVMDLFRPAVEAAEFFETTLKRKLVDYNNKVEEENRKIQLEAQEKARKEQEKLEVKATKAEENGNFEKAEQLQFQAASVVAAPVLRQTKVYGSCVRTIYKCRLVSLQQLMKSILEGKAPITLVSFNEAEANKLAMALKGGMTYDGVEFYVDKSVAIR